MLRQHANLRDPSHTMGEDHGTYAGRISLASKSLRADESVCQIGREEEGDRSAQGVFKQHVNNSLECFAHQSIEMRKKEEDGGQPDVDDIHGVAPVHGMTARELSPPRSRAVQRP